MSTYVERFWARVVLGLKPNDCAIWNGGKTDGGHGVFWHHGRTVTAHTFSYETLVGPIPKGTEIDHLCRVRSCVIRTTWSRLRMKSICSAG